MLLLSIITLLSTIAWGQTYGNSSKTYTNPILDTVGADPWVIRHDGYYYMTYTTNDNITLLRSNELTNWNDAESRLIFKPEPGLPYSTDIWAPELHLFDDSWYIIFTADPRFDSPSPEIDMYCPFNCPAVNHRMFVLSSSTSDPWTAEFTYKAELDTYDQFAIDGTYFKHSTGLYHVYSCWYQKYDAWPANLCITKMSDPWTVTTNFTERVILSVPSNPWEKTPYGRSVNDRLSSNEAPQQLTNPSTGQEFIIYSAARSDNRNYCLGLLELVGSDPMNPGDWLKESSGCVFYQNPSEQAYGVGHASFVKSEEGSEDWIVYHGMRDPSNGWGARTIRTQKFTWAENGRPVFPRPGYGPYSVPSGEV
ncbi:glycoside hydrolase family 43 protein [Amniculicola lignicola CBS 123094]|uniref:Glycoside hydrolase family 43 protein n=1 Tax=Amniculicola lignicola CBS 123094 TaxID=1392246 RepID=A0A6A5WW67_9PLEO|nr:glycoside hydrolase family 43 protein [Amniculicola lignicola CBS 123094]